LKFDVPVNIIWDQVLHKMEKKLQQWACKDVHFASQIIIMVRNLATSHVLTLLVYFLVQDTSSRRFFFDPFSGGKQQGGKKG